MCDDVARILAMAALEAAQGGGGRKGINNVYIKDGHLHIVFSDGLDSDVGEVVGKDGAVYAPSIITDPDGRRILHWDIVEKPEEVPEDIVLRMERAEWTDVEPNERGDKYSEIEWKDVDSVDDEHPEQGFSGDDKSSMMSSSNNSGSDDYYWDTI